MKTGKRVFKNSVWLLTANVAVRLISAFVIVLLARKLGTAGFGQYSFALSFVGFFALFTNFGFNSLMIRDIAKDKSLTNKYINNILSIKILFSITALLALVISSFFIGKSTIIITAIYIFGIDLVISSFSESMRCLFHAYEIMEFDSILKIIEKLLWAGLILVVIFNNLTLFNVAIATLCSASIGLIITYFVVRKKISKIKLESDFVFWKKVIILAWPFALTSLFAAINFRIDQVMLSFMTTDTLVGTYSAAYKIIDILVIIPNILLTALYPVFSKYYHDNKKMLKKIFNISLRYVIALAIPVVTGVFLLSNKIIDLIYGTEYLASAQVLKILIFISLFTFVNTPFFVLLNAIGKQKITMMNTGFTALANVIMNILLIPRFSIIGAAIATILSEITFLVLSYYQIRKSGIKLNIITKAYKPVIASILMGAFVWYFLDWNIFALIPIGAVIYFSILLLLREFSKEDFDIARNILRRKTK
jgi:O-antigen/teichoic acid export membrane protein